MLVPGLRACARVCKRGQVIMLAVAKCDRLAAVPQLLLSFELFLQNTKASKTISNKVRAPIPWECPVTTSFARHCMGGGGGGGGVLSFSWISLRKLH